MELHGHQENISLKETNRKSLCVYIEALDVSK